MTDYKRLSTDSSSLFTKHLKEYTFKVTDNFSDDLSLLDTEVERYNKNKKKKFKWVMADCGKHIKLNITKSGVCRLCKQDRDEQFLKEKNVEILDRVSANTYLVKLQCGHEKLVKPDEWNFSDYCIECRNEKVISRFPDGTEIIEFSQKGQRVKLRFPCGHESVRHTYSEDSGICVECRTEDKQLTLTSLGITENKDKTFNLPCGHITGKVGWQTLGSYKCLDCERDLIHKNALSLGLKATGNYDSVRKMHEFTLTCGHTKWLKTTGIKASVVCSVCGEDHYNKPCDMYFIICFADNFSFIKIGIANDTNQRISEYKSTKLVNAWMVYASAGFSTKREAVKVEKEFHKKFSDKRLDPVVAKQYINCGFTECYPIEMLTELSSVFSKIVDEHGHSVHFKKVNYD